MLRAVPWDDSLGRWGWRSSQTWRKLTIQLLGPHRRKDRQCFRSWGAARTRSESSHLIFAGDRAGDHRNLTLGATEYDHVRRRGDYEGATGR